MSDSVNAIEIESQAAEWLEKRNHAEWTEADQAQLESWLQKSLANRIAYLRLEDAWRFADRLSALKAIRPDVDHSKSKWPKRVGGTLAACLLVAVGVVGIRLNTKAPIERTYATDIGASKRLTLADGSQIEMNTDTVIRIGRDGDARKVWLDKGEAYFQVKHDRMHPFVVMADGHQLLDVGTKFLVRREQDKLQVSVLEGEVQFDPKRGSPAPTLLTSGDVLTATRSSVSISRAGATEIANALGWRSGVITLDNSTLADAVSEFNRYSRERIVIADPKVAQLRIMGTFQAGNANAFVSVAQDIFKLHVKRDQDEIVISR